MIFYFIIEDLLNHYLQKKFHILIEINTTIGDVDVEHLSAKNSIEINTTLGDVDGSIKGSPADYSISSSTTLGHNSLKKITGKGNIILSVNTTSGDIDLDFER